MQQAVVKHLVVAGPTSIQVYEGGLEECITWAKRRVTEDGAPAELRVITVTVSEEATITRTSSSRDTKRTPRDGSTARVTTRRKGRGRRG